MKVFGERFLAVGLPAAIGLALFTMLVIVLTKNALTKRPVGGLTEFVQAV